MNHTSFTDYSGAKTDSIHYATELQTITIETLLSVTGAFDGAGGWIEYDTPIYETKNKLIFNEVESVDNLDGILHATIQNITSTEMSDKKYTYTITTADNKSARIICRNISFC